MTRRRALAGATAAVALAAALCAAGCSGARTAPAEPRGTLRFAIEPGDALVDVDETRLGPASMLEQRGLLLRVGEHRVVVSRDGYFTEHRLIEIRDGEVAALELALTPVPE